MSHRPRADEKRRSKLVPTVEPDFSPQIGRRRINVEVRGDTHGWSAAKANRVIIKRGRTTLIVYAESDGIMVAFKRGNQILQRLHSSMVI